MGTDYYANAAAAGGGDGSQGSPFTFAEAIAFINGGGFVDGDAMNLQNSGGVFNISDTIISSAGSLYQRKNIKGCTSIADDGGFASIVRSSGSGKLIEISGSNWFLQNLLIDGGLSGTYVLYLGNTIVKNCRVERAGTDGIYSGYIYNCHIRDCLGNGVNWSTVYNTLSENNGGIGVYFPTTAYNVISKDNTGNNFYAHTYSRILNCISDGGQDSGFFLINYSNMMNCVAINAPVGKHGVRFASPGPDRGMPLCHNVDFYNNDSNSNALGFIDDYYTLDPQFNDPANNDYSRIGTNLDDLGFSDIGMVGVDYHVDIGPDQGATTTAPTTPTLTLTDKADGTGFTAELSGEDAGTINTLYIGQSGGSFSSERYDWDSLDQIDVAADNGRWYAYVVSSNVDKNVVTDVEEVTVTGGESEAADDNVPVAVRAMKQKAVYWEQLSVDVFGKPTWDEPVEIDCRWEDVQEEFIDANGDREMSRARLIVDRDVEIKGVLWLGELTNVPDSDDPKENDGAWEIRLFKKIPNFKGTKFLREVYL